MTRMTRPILALLFLLTIPAFAVAQTPRPDQATDEGTVVSVSRSTVVIKTASGDYKLYELTPNTNRPKTIVVGSVVVVTSVPSEAGQMLATQVAVVTPAPAGAAKAPPDANVPSSVTKMENSIKRQTSKYKIGVRAGAALDPELIVVGAHGQFGPMFSKNFYARPNIEFLFGEVTDIFAINLEFVYRMPVTSQQAKWAFYFGGGPTFNFIKEGFEDTEDDFSFDDFEYDTGLNILAGVQARNGLFMELKAAAYAPPTIRFLVGFSF